MPPFIISFIFFGEVNSGFRSFVCLFYNPICQNDFLTYNKKIKYSVNIRTMFGAKFKYSIFKRFRIRFS